MKRSNAEYCDRSDAAFRYLPDPGQKSFSDRKAAEVLAKGPLRTAIKDGTIYSVVFFGLWMLIQLSAGGADIHRLKKFAPGYVACWLVYVGVGYCKYRRMQRKGLAGNAMP